jgi:hypothetical protein
MTKLGRSIYARAAGALLTMGLLTGCHSEGTILFELPQSAVIDNVASLQANADNLYFTAVRDGELMKLPKAGGTPGAIATNVVEYVLVGDAIVFRDGAGALFEMPAEGGARRSLTEGGVLRESLAATADQLYWVDLSGTDGGVSIMSMPRDASRAPEVLATEESKPRSLRVDAAGDVFWSTVPFRDSEHASPSRVRMVPAGGGKPVTVVESSDQNHQIEIIVVDDAFVYTDAEPGELHRVPRAGGKPKVIAQLEARTQLTLFDGTLYGYQSSEGRIISVPATGGDWSEIAVGHPNSIAVDDAYVYWANAAFADGSEGDPTPDISPASIARAPR